MSMHDARENRTPRELARMPDGKGFELWAGRLVERRVGARSSWIGGQVFGRLSEGIDHEGYLWPAGLGLAIFPASPSTVYRPAVTFLGPRRSSWADLAGDFLEIAPDLVVEVLSPHDRAIVVERKIRDYLAAGVRLVWVIVPELRTVRVERADGSVTRLRPDGQLSGEGVVPGFSCRVDDLFPPPAAPPS